MIWLVLPLTIQKMRRAKPAIQSSNKSCPVTAALGLMIVYHNPDRLCIQGQEFLLQEGRTISEGDSLQSLDGQIISNHTYDSHSLLKSLPKPWAAQPIVFHIHKAGIVAKRVEPLRGG